MAIDKPVVRRNFAFNIVEGALFVSTTGFNSIQTVIPALVSRLGGSNVLVGAVSVIFYVGVFLPQSFAARYLETLPWKKPWTIRFGFSHRLVVGILGLVILLFGEHHSSLALGLFLAFYAVGQVLAGITSPGWFEFFAKLTPIERIGTLVGIRNSLGGAGAFVAGLVLTWLLSEIRFPYSYAVAFFSAFALQMGSLAVQLQLVEQEPSTVVDRKLFFAYLRDLPQVLRRNREFRNFIAASALSILALMPANFFTVHALSLFHGGDTIVGEFTLVLVATQVLSALLSGIVADRWGNKAALVIAGGGMFFASLTALFAPSLHWFRLVYVFLGINMGTEMMARYNMAIQYGPVAQRSTYIGLMNTLLAPFYLSSLIGGWMSDALGYTAVFALGAGFSLLALSALFLIVQDPRMLRRPNAPVTGTR
jgi:MFS family permease